MTLEDIFAELVRRAQTLLSELIQYSPRLIAGLVVAVIMYAAVRISRRGVRTFARRTTAPPEVEQLIVNVGYVLALFLALTVTLSVLGVNVYGLVAGLGISGLVIGFALKDIIENMLAGVLVLIQRPFEVNDLIKVADIQGHVTHIDLRATRIRTLDQLEVIVPNRVIYTSIITNYNAYALRRNQVSFGVGYNEDLARASQIMLDTVQGFSDIATDPAPFLRYDSFGDSAIAGALYYYVDTTSYDYYATQSSLIEQLQRAINTHNIDLPYPIQTVINK